MAVYDDQNADEEIYADADGVDKTRVRPGGGGSGGGDGAGDAGGDGGGEAGGGGEDGESSPEELKDAEESGGEPKREKSEREKLDDEEAAMLAGGNERFKAAREADKARGDGKEDDLGFYRPEGKKKGFRDSRSGGFGSLLKNRKMIAGAGVGVTALLTMGVAMFGFLNLFKLDFIFDNVDSQTFSRFNATFDRRSDKWIRAYVQMRLAEIDGGQPGDSLIFRANRVDTNNPAHDWYRTLRTSNFEERLFKENGIRLTSIAREENGIIRFRPALIEINNQTKASFTSAVDGREYNAAALRSGQLDVDLRNYLNAEFDVDSRNSFITVFDNDRDGRRLIKRVVKDNTFFFQVIKRRHIRKGIQNMTGIRDWTLFEKTREKYETRKIGIQQKLVNKILPSDTNTGKFLQCLFGFGPCTGNTDPNAPDNQATAGSGTGESRDPGTIDETGPDGETITNPLDGSEVGGDAGAAIGNAVDDDAAELLPTEKLMKKLMELVGKVLGNPALKIWTWLKMLASIDKAFGGGKDNKLVQLVANARRTQLMGVYTAYGIAKDQAKSGELVSDELGDLMQTTRNFHNSEGWNILNENKAAEAVSAQVANNPTKEEYCDPNHEKTFDEYAWFCDDQKIGNSGRIGAITDMYNNTIGKIIGPIAIVVNGINRLPVIGSVLNFVQGLVDKISGQIMATVMRVTGAGRAIESVASAAMGMLLQFSGIGPMFDGSQPGFLNYMMAGSAAVAEATLRGSGAALSTVRSRAYSTQLATEYQAETLASQSTYERYLSLDNKQSAASKIAFSASETDVGKLTNVSNWFKGAGGSLASIFSGRIFAQSTPEKTDIADFVGAEKYDIPELCIDLDPFSATYLQDGTNADEYGVELTWDLVRNSSEFWAAVYAEIGDHPERAKQVYNCHLLDQRVQSGIGHIYGYENDGGIGTQNETASTAPAPGTIDNPADCPTAPVDATALSNIRGILIHTCTDDRLEQLLITAQSAGLALDGSGWRSIDTQVQLRMQNCGISSPTDPEIYNSARRCNPPTAIPGSSNHERGLAVDFYNCSTRATACWQWLNTNASRFGFYNLDSEPWHWSTNGR